MGHTAPLWIPGPRDHEAGVQWGSGTGQVSEKGSPRQLWLWGPGGGWSQAHVTVGRGQAGVDPSDPLCACAGDELELIRPSVYRNVARQLNISVHSESVVTDALLAVAAQIFCAGGPARAPGGPAVPERPGSALGPGCGASLGFEDSGPARQLARTSHGSCRVPAGAAVTESPGSAACPGLPVGAGYWLEWGQGVLHVARGAWASHSMAPAPKGEHPEQPLGTAGLL